MEVLTVPITVPELPPLSFPQILFADDVVTVENGSGLVTRDLPKGLSCLFNQRVWFSWSGGDGNRSQLPLQGFGYFKRKPLLIGILVIGGMSYDFNHSSVISLWQWLLLNLDSGPFLAQ